MKSKSKPKPNESMKRLREILGKTQEQFAAMIGYTIHAVASVETGRVRLTPAMNRAIIFATGASLLRQGFVRVTAAGIKAVPDEPVPNGEIRVAWGWPGKDKTYTRASFEKHRKLFEETEENAERVLNECLPDLKMLFQAAGRPSFGGMRDRLPALLYSLREWMNEQNSTFNLNAEFSEAKRWDPWLEVKEQKGKQ
jgi:transcriptional regulator with XRE-family HTH domain